MGVGGGGWQGGAGGGGARRGLFYCMQLCTGMEYNGSLRLYVVANVSCVSCTETLLIGNYSFTL